VVVSQSLRRSAIVQRLASIVNSTGSHLAGRPVRFRFHLTNGKLYSFWVSPNETGASQGYLAGGGPGFTGPSDTVGRGAG